VLLLRLESLEFCSAAQFELAMPPVAVCTACSCFCRACIWSPIVAPPINPTAAPMPAQQENLIVS
jgi:hypothetical protein